MTYVVSTNSIAQPAILIGADGEPYTAGAVVGGATAAKQDTQITAEQAILAKLTSDPATQTTLAAVLAKIIAAPATAANQATEIASLATIATNSALVPIGGAYTDRSIASLAGSSETLMGVNASRRTLIVYNIGATSVAVNLTGGAASLTVGGSVVIPAGGSLVLDSYPPTALIKVIGTAAAAVTAYEG